MSMEPNKGNDMATKHLCAEYTDGDYPVQLYQIGFDRFIVQYGKQVKRTMSYAEAGVEFGLCVMHSAACAGKLDSRTRTEAHQAGDFRPFEPKKSAW